MKHKIDKSILSNLLRKARRPFLFGTYVGGIVSVFAAYFSIERAGFPAVVAAFAALAYVSVFTLVNYKYDSFWE